MKKKVYGLIILTTLVLAAVAVKPLLAYVTAKSLSRVDGSIVPNKWLAPGPISWTLDPTQGSNFTGSQSIATVFSNAFGAWASVVPVTLTPGGDLTKAQGFNHYDGVNFVTTNAKPGDLPVGVLAETVTFYFDAPGPDPVVPGRTITFPGQIMEADMEFSSAYTFSTNPGAKIGQVDLQAVATHEAGHFLGMDHASNVSSTMFWETPAGFINQRNLSSDDIAGISTLYPPPTFAATGTLSGTVRTTSNDPVYGAIVVAVDTNGVPVASTVTDPSGLYTIQGLTPGTYSVFAEPLSGRITKDNIGTLLQIYPSATVNTAFTTRYH
jgi:hypothetical protein